MLVLLVRCRFNRSAQGLCLTFGIATVGSSAGCSTVVVVKKCRSFLAEFWTPLRPYGAIAGDVMAGKPDKFASYDEISSSVRPDKDNIMNYLIGVTMP